MSFTVGTLPIVSGQDTSQKVPTSGIKAVLIGNESGLTVTIAMEGGGVQKTLYPSMLDWFAVKPGFTGNIKVHPVTVLNNVAAWPSSSLIFDAIGVHDHENASMYPVAIPRVSNTGNSNAATLDGSGNLALTGDLQLANNKHVQWKSTVDSLFKNALYLDAANQFNIQAIPTIELINLKKSDGTTKAIFDLINNIFTMHGAMNLDPTGLVDNGSTSGTATLYQLLVGNVKLVFIDQSTFRNGGAAITRALPTPFTHGGLIVALNCADFALLKTAAAVSVNSIISFSATTGAATIVAVTTIAGSSISGGGGTTGWDSVQYTGGNTVSHNGGIFMIGV